MCFNKSSETPPAKKKSVDAALVRWFASSDRPINIIEDSDFKSLLKVATGCDYKIPSRPTVSSRVDDIYESSKIKLVKELENEAMFP